MTDQLDLRDRTSGDAARRRLLAAAPVTERRLDLAGVSTAVLEGGSGPPAVLLHGPGAYGSTWLPVLRTLVGSHRVIAPDLPGHGASVVMGGVLDASRVLDWLGELCEQTCRTPAVLVGHLVGGAIAAHFASDRDHFVGRLVLVTPTGLAPFAPAPRFGAVFAGYLTNPTGDTHDQLWRECVSDLDELRTRMGARWDDMKRYNIDRARTPAVVQAQRTLLDQFGMQIIRPEVLAGITAPTTLIWGRHDTIVPLAVGTAASSRYGWPLQVIETGNEPALEAPEALFRAAFGSVAGSS
jgi:pimeloyl-ACP methyl ester carboxylesterase